VSCLLFAEPSFSSDEQRDVRGWLAADGGVTAGGVRAMIYASFD
jgi:hypothetical protein